ncbi:carboxypeptidase-like regulatory domain-containing protein [Haloferula chungangensis]|uniref:Carboxypeptidase-like regulatory domain-containing protein n=1 Tax=Haloferula chungangensis TaxID=1048331 RepID=A0ABW2LBH9_9BACT
MPTDLESLISQLNTSITVYGKVVDQFGDPVPDATVRLSPINRLEDSYGKKVITTDSDGKFSGEGLYGKSLGISAEKEGYLRIPPMNARSSAVILRYERGGGGTGDRYAHPSNPIVLELLKIGPVEPMIHISRKRWKLPLDGTPTMIALDSEEGQGAHEIEVRFASNWNQLPKDNAINSKLFDWSFEIRVPGGGLAWDPSDLEFEAPEAGYKESVRYEFPATLPRGEWKRVRDGRYFVKFADNTSGRIQFQIDGGSDRRPLRMESWLNLKPGSRNLATERMIINVVKSEEPVQ